MMSPSAPTVSGRPAEVPGADSMVGLLINTVPVRATITTATTATDLLDQLHRAHNHTLDHQHLALNEIHRVTGHDQSVRHPVRLRELPDRHRRSCRASTGWPSPSSANREYNHYPLAIHSRTRATNWSSASNSTPTCSTRPTSKR